MIRQFFCRAAPPPPYEGSCIGRGFLLLLSGPEKKAPVTITTVCVTGLRGELAVEEEEENERTRARDARRKERKDIVVRQRQQKREVARKAMEEEGGCVCVWVL